MTVAQFDTVARAVQQHVYDACGVILSGVTPYPDTPDDPELRKVRAAIARAVWSLGHVVELRGLYVDKASSTVRFDAIVEFGSGDINELQAQAVEACEAACPGWNIVARVIPDISD